MCLDHNVNHHYSTISNPLDGSFTGVPGGAGYDGLYVLLHRVGHLQLRVIPGTHHIQFTIPFLERWIFYYIYLFIQLNVDETNLLFYQFTVTLLCKVISKTEHSFAKLLSHVRLLVDANIPLTTQADEMYEITKNESVVK